MQRPRWLILILIGLVAASALGAGEDDLEANRRLLERWKLDPDHYRRLQSDLAAFRALPAARQEQMRKLDRDLHELDLSAQTKLWAVLERYHRWLEQLPEEQRQRVKNASTSEERLKIIAELRQREWVDHLPEKTRRELAKLPEPRRSARIAELRKLEREQRERWTATDPSGTSNPRPVRLNELPPEVQKFYRENLEPRLTFQELAQVKKAEGQWPGFVRLIQTLSDRHPVLPPGPLGEIASKSDLPPEVRKVIPKKMNLLDKGKGVRPKLAVWPEFALLVTLYCRNNGKKCPPLGASKLSEFPREVQNFVKGKLLPQLTPAQKKLLHAQEGRWPDYPKMLLNLAKQKKLQIPGMSLPGPTELWAESRAWLPDVPDRVLFNFALYELSDKDRAGLGLNVTDFEGSREKLKKAYFKKKPEQLKRGKDRFLTGVE